VGLGGIILATTDGGATWNTQMSSGGWLHGVAFANTVDGWAVGDSGTILATTDGGAHWPDARFGDLRVTHVRRLRQRQ